MTTATTLRYQERRATPSHHQTCLQCIQFYTSYLTPHNRANAHPHQNPLPPPPHHQPVENENESRNEISVLMYHKSSDIKQSNDPSCFCGALLRCL
ncbi:4411_t:CDS:2 [Entrophospora sp. SA101]|nr:4411_t:CDS:2 [Entrophospora sp. SA101]CAJ0835095.1 19280_t:CDS:2 [Entrophospora sp. SA101]